MRSVISCNVWILLSAVAVITSSSLAQAQESKSDKPIKPTLLTAQHVAEVPGDNELRKLLKARYNAAIDELQATQALYLSGQAPFELLVDSGKRVAQAGVEMHDNTAEKIALLTQYVELAKANEQHARRHYESGVTSVRELHLARYERLRAEIELLRTKQASVNP